MGFRSGRRGLSNVFLVSGEMSHALVPPWWSGMGGQAPQRVDPRKAMRKDRRYLPQKRRPLLVAFGPGCGAQNGPWIGFRLGLPRRTRQQKSQTRGPTCAD